MRVGQSRKRDAAEREIVQALEACGVRVTPVSGPGAPDLIWRFQGKVGGLEIKSATGKRTAAQEETQWPIVRSISEALAVIGVKT